MGTIGEFAGAGTGIVTLVAYGVGLAGGAGLVPLGIAGAGAGCLSSIGSGSGAGLVVGTAIWIGVVSYEALY